MTWPEAIRSRIPRETRTFVHRCLLALLGAVWGFVLWVPLVLAAIMPPGSRASRRIIAWERRRQDVGYGLVLAGTSSSPRLFALAHAAIAGILGWPVLVLAQGFVVVTIGGLLQTVIGDGAASISFDVWTIVQPGALVGIVYGAASLISAVALSELAGWLHGLVDAHFATVSRPRARQTRIGELLTTRQGVVMAIDDERRRIERDLHDGVQQNVVSLSVLIARARRATDTEKVDALLDDALAQSQDLIDEMREVAWRVYPTALDEHGLPSVLERLADHSPVPVDLIAVPADRLPPEIESATYFLIREAVTNVVKHAEAQRIRISVRLTPTTVVAEVVDDGCGGADTGGSGLHGLARRVGALDGTLEIISPPGAGTTVRAEIPYARP